ncbi:MAG: hypothetical protein WC289_06190, partial [Patescibacteria group bacterium]
MNFARIPRTRKVLRSLLAIGSACAAVAILFFVAPEPTHAASRTFAMQGRVTVKDATAVADGTYPMIFRLYAAPFGGTLLWSESWQSVNVIKSTFSVELGSLSPLTDIDFAGGPYWVSLEFNNDGEMSPRVKLTAVPHALSAERLGSRLPSDFLAKGEDLDLGTQALTTTGQISAGTLLQGGSALNALFLKLSGGTVVGPVSFQGSGATLTVGSSATFAGTTTFSGSAHFQGSVSVSGVSGLTDGDIPDDLTINADGSVATGALPSVVSLLGPSIESAEITDGTLLNADVNASASIAYSKLSLTNAIVGGDLSSAISIQTSGSIVTEDRGGTASGDVTVGGLLTGQAGFALTGSLTLPDRSITDANLSTNVSLLNANQAFSGVNQFITSVGIPVSIDNFTGANSILVVKDNGSPVFSILDGGNAQFGNGL